MSVDFRTFFPYIPNEVKHRKRTSRHQLKVLEDVFRKDTKPNAVLRKKLAAELEMSPRAVQVWFQNRRAKEKALRKRVAVGPDQDKPASPSTKKTPPLRDSSPNDSSNSSTATEMAARHAEDGPPPAEPSASPVLKLSCSPPLLPGMLSSEWTGFSGTPVDVPHHARLLDASAQDPDLYSTRRGSLPTVMPSQPFMGPNLAQLPLHYPDRRNSMDVSFYRLMHHPFARIAKEKNEALFLPKSPLSPAGSIPANVTRAPGIGPMRTNGHGYPLPRPSPSHRTSEPQVFASVRTPFPPVPEGGPLQSLVAPSRRFSDNRLYAISSRTIPSPIPGPLPTPDFQFGDPSSVSPPNASPTPGEVESPQVPMQSPEIAQLQRWSFPRSREPDQDTEDSGSYSALSRFGSVASVSGSDSSAMFSDVSSCVAVDHIGYDPSTTRRGSCASGNYLEMRLSGLNMTGRSSQGSLNEAQLNAAATLAYRDKLARQEHPSEAIGGYVSPASTASPGTSPHVRQVKEPGLSALRSEGIYDYGPLSQVPENDEITTTRRGSIQAQEPLPHIYVPNQQGPYPNSPSEARTSLPQQHYPHGSGFTPQSNFSHSGEPPFAPGSRSAQPDSSYPQQQSTQFQYSPEGTFQGASNSMAVPHPSVSRYAPPTSEYTYSASHGQEPFASFT
ncbi:hypothetical protein OG21DRAFT_1602978 [Imleria badia]|nr:hypothetical protein OG21DRAFT_1602978 [Imleria badia]